MTLTLKPPETPTATLKALAASGSSLYARKAQAALQARVLAELRKELGRP